MKTHDVKHTTSDEGLFERWICKTCGVQIERKGRSSLNAWNAKVKRWRKVHSPIILDFSKGRKK